MRQKLLLLEDVDDLGKSGDVVLVKSGYARNFLFPKKKAVVADKHTLLMQEKLQKERAVKAAEDKKEAEELAALIQDKTFEVIVKVDPEGKMYGSVSQKDIVEILAKEGLVIEKKFIQLKHPIKETGVAEIILKLKEGVPSSFHLKIIPESSKSEEPVKQE